MESWSKLKTSSWTPMRTLSLLSSIWKQSSRRLKLLRDLMIQGRNFDRMTILSRSHKARLTRLPNGKLTKLPIKRSLGKSRGFDLIVSPKLILRKELPWNETRTTIAPNSSPRPRTLAPSVRDIPFTTQARIRSFPLSQWSCFQTDLERTLGPSLRRGSLIGLCPNTMKLRFFPKTRCLCESLREADETGRKRRTM